jgi:hypothetical protein
MVSAHSSIYKGHLIYPRIGMHFGGVWCPANSEPITRATNEIAEFLFNHSTYQLDLNKDVLPKFKIHVPSLKQPWPQLTWIAWNKPNPAQMELENSNTSGYSQMIVTYHTLMACFKWR